MFYSTEAIVLNAVKYGDSKLIVDMLTEAIGRLSFAVTLPKTSRGKMRRQLFQPLTIIHIEFDYRQTTDIQRLRDIRLSVPYASLPFSSPKLSIAFFLSEFLTYATRMNISDGNFYSFVRNSLLFLDTTSDGFANFHIVFMLRLTHFFGVFPDTGTFTDGYFFDLREGCFTPNPPFHSDYLTPSEANTFSTLMRLTFSTMHLFAASRHERNRITEAIVHYYQLHLSSFPNLQSLPILREL